MYFVVKLIYHFLNLLIITKIVIKIYTCSQALHLQQGRAHIIIQLDCCASSSLASVSASCRSVLSSSVRFGRTWKTLEVFYAYAISVFFNGLHMAL